MTSEAGITLVTGAGSGIGRAVAARLEAAGSRVARVDLAVDGQHPLSFSVDVAEDCAVAELVARIEAEHGPVDGLVNCAGVACGGSMDEVDMADWDRAMAVNLRGTASMCQQVLRVMMPRRRGSIVNIGSTFGLLARNGCVAYSVSKAAVIQLTRCMAVDLADNGVRVNCVCPGMIETAMTEPLYTDEAREIYLGNAQAHAMRRTGQPEEVAEAVAFLMSDAASFITGAAVPVDGGYTSGKWV